MAFFYVKLGGTATADAGRYSTQQTGSFATMGAANYYDNVLDAKAATTPPTTGDFYCLSHLHVGVILVGTQTWAGGYPDPITIISVDDANCDVYKKGAEEGQATGSLRYIGDLVLRGVDLIVGSYIDADQNGAHLTIIDGSFDTNHASSLIVASTTGGSWLTLLNSDLVLSASAMELRYAAGFTWIGGTLVGSGISRMVTNGSGLNGGCSLYIENVDLSGLTGIIFDTSLSYASGPTHVKIINCKVDSGVTYFATGNPPDGHWKWLATGNGSGAGAEYQYLYKSNNGQAEEDTAIYRDGSNGFRESGTKISLKVATTSGALPSNYFMFEMPSSYVALSGADDVISLYILSSATLTDLDVWAEIAYPDGTNREVSNFVSSDVDMHDPFRTGTTLTTNTESWTGRVAENRYQIDLDTSGDVGKDCVPIIRVYVSKASANIYFCPTIGLS